MFTRFKKAMQDHFALLRVQGGHTLYKTNVDPDHLWQAYLGWFPEDIRQEYNCNCCKSFIRHYGGLVFIINNRLVTIWDFPCEPPFKEVSRVLDELVRESVVTDIFFIKEARLGTNTSTERTETQIIRWEHLFFELPKNMVSIGADSVESLMGKARDNRNVFARGLAEITLDAIDIVLDLIAQNALYRGMEYKGVLEGFRKLKVNFDGLRNAERENYCWAEAPKHAGSVAQIRNTAIGTLLIDISERKDLDIAVVAFERIMAPTNYKRPTALITQKMIEQAEITIEELGFGNSLGRRFATLDDLTVDNLLFVNRDIKGPTGILSDLNVLVAVNPKTLNRVDDIPVSEFVGKILPKCNSVEVLFENRHAGNLFSLITAKDASAPSLFKWNNPFSWSYKDAVADSMKERVKAAGGQVEGELRFSLEWYNFDDLDLHVEEPDGNTIWFRNKTSPSGGNLDVDMNAGSGKTREAVENIIFPTSARMREGIYKVYVDQYCQRETIDVGFSMEIECQGQVFTLGYDQVVKRKIPVAEVEYSKRKGITLKSSIGHSTKVNTRTIWGIDTNKFYKVSVILNSPNMWNGQLHGQGNAHLFFVVDQVHNDEIARGFFNEFLKPELESHKRVFEALGSRMRVEPADKQVSGLGFSSTQHSEVICKVEGHFTRTLRIKF